MGTQHNQNNQNQDKNLNRQNQNRQDQGNQQGGGMGNEQGGNAGGDAIHRVGKRGRLGPGRFDHAADQDRTADVGRQNPHPPP